MKIPQLARGTAVVCRSFDCQVPTTILHARENRPQPDSKNSEEVNDIYEGIEERKK